MTRTYRPLLPLIVCITCSVATGDPKSQFDLVPVPASFKFEEGRFTVSRKSTLLFSMNDNEIRRIARLITDAIHTRTGVRIAEMESAGVKFLRGSTIWLSHTTDGTELGDEGYKLNIGFGSATLIAKNPCGTYRGVQTLLQLMPPPPDNMTDVTHFREIPLLPCLSITDAPRFRHRGMLLDCGRHFMTKDFVKRYIDLLAYHKMNVLHWHLTEDQGWRIEIKKHPKLTEIGAWRKATRESEQPLDAKGRYGGFYTQDDIREIVAYAQSRYITIIPEIEMPGHSLATLAARPDLSCTGGPFQVGTEWGVIDDVYCAGNDATFEFLQDVLTEVIALFPGEYIHIGGDECPKARWKKCAKCQKRIRDEKLKDEHELQSYFIRRIEKFLNAKGRRLIGWDEILEGGLAPNATVQAWRGMDAAATAARAGHDVIVSPTSHCYLDYPQYSPDADPLKAFAVDKVFAFDPMPQGLEASHQKHILGVEGNIWTERAPQDMVDNRVFPRLCAIAEIGWSQAEPRDWKEFRGRLQEHLQRLEAMGVTPFIDPPRFVSGVSPFADSTEVALESPVREGQILYTLDGSAPNGRSPRYERPLRLTQTTVVKMRLLLDDSRVSDVVSRLFRREADNKSEQGAPATPTSSPSGK